MPKTHTNNTTKKSSIDMPADNPEGTMDRFTDGLKRVIASKRPSKSVKPKHSGA
jgi:hypothetical protein